MKDSQQKLTDYTGEEYLKILNLAKSIFEPGISDASPKFVILIGGVGSGKTTMRKDKYVKGYVQFDFGEILMSLRKIFGNNDSRMTDSASAVCEMVMEESLGKKKNIVIEIIGDKKDVIEPVIDGITKLGYKVSIVYVSVDPAEGYKRHLKAVHDDANYFSAYYSQEATLAFFYTHLGLGKMPQITPSAG